QLRGDGDLMVFDHDTRLVGIGTGSESCGQPGYTASICATIRRGDHFAPADSVSGHLVAVREPDAVAVVDDQGRLVRVFPFATADGGGRVVFVPRAEIVRQLDGSAR